MAFGVHPVSRRARGPLAGSNRPFGPCAVVLSSGARYGVQTHSQAGLLLIPSILTGQDLPGVAASPVEAERAIEIGGRLDEPVWVGADVATGFRQREPDEGRPATERTEVRVLFDGAALYVGVTAFDENPDRIIARVLQRDRVMVTGFDRALEFAGDDAVAIVFDPFHGHRNGVVFATDPIGAEFDALITGEGREVNIDWRGVWSVASARTADGWSAEFRIPLRSLRLSV